MLINLKQLHKCNIEGTDGNLGSVEDVYFDDRYWTIRYLVVDTNPWMPLSDKVLVSPISLLSYNAQEAEIHASLSKNMIENCPKIEDHEPVSRTFEKSYFDYFGYGYYWMGADTWGEYAHPMDLVDRDMVDQVKDKDGEKPKENHMRSADEIDHYSVDASDGMKGQVQDLIWDTKDWTMKYLILDTRDWLPGGKKVFVLPQHCKSLNWENKSISCNLTIEQIKNCPEYDVDKLNDEGYLKTVKTKLEATL